MRIRTAAPEDGGAVARLVRAYHDFEGIASSEVEVAATMAALLADPAQGVVYVAEDAGALVAYGALTYGFSIEHGGRDAFIDEFFVAAGHRGRGIGGALLAHIEAEARRMGLHALHLVVAAGNDRAARLYAKAGFRGNDRQLITRLLG